MASAILHAPATLTTILLPSLAAGALIVLHPNSKSRIDETNGSSSR